MGESERPLIVFELRFVLLGAEGRKGRPVRPGVHHLLSLLEFFDVGFFNGVEDADLQTQDNRLRNDKLPLIYKALCFKNHCTQSFFAKHEHRSCEDMFHPILTTYEEKDPQNSLRQKMPAQHERLNQRRVIIVDQSAKYRAAQWEPNVIQCMWPSRDFPTEYQWESADEIGLNAAEPDKTDVPVLRMLCRLLIDAHVSYKLHSPGRDVRPAVTELKKQIERVTRMARNQAPIRWEEHHPTCLHSIFHRPRLPSRYETLMLFPSAIQFATTFAPTEYELQIYRSTINHPYRQSECRPTQRYVGYSRKPTILINMDLLVNVQKWPPSRCGMDIPAMPGVQHICSLRPYFRVGVFCDWAETPARAATSCLNSALRTVLKSQHESIVKLQKLIKESTVSYSADEDDDCIAFLLHSTGGRSTYKEYMTHLVDACDGLDHPYTLILDVDRGQKQRFTEHPSTVVVPRMAAMKTNRLICKDVPDGLNVKTGHYPVLKIISAVSTACWAKHKNHAGVSIVTRVASELQQVLDQVHACTYNPPPPLSSILQAKHGWVHAPQLVLPRESAFSDEALRPLCSSLLRKGKQEESRAAMHQDTRAKSCQQYCNPPANAIHMHAPPHPGAPAGHSAGPHAPAAHPQAPQPAAATGQAPAAGAATKTRPLYKPKSADGQHPHAHLHAAVPGGAQPQHQQNPVVAHSHLYPVATASAQLVPAGMYSYPHASTLHALAPAVQSATVQQVHAPGPMHQAAQHAVPSANAAVATSPVPRQASCASQVPGVNPAAAVAPQDEPMHDREADLNAADENARLLAEQDKENNPYRQRLVSDEGLEYMMKRLRPPDMPMHTGFVHPEQTMLFATTYNLSPLHFEMYDLMLHLSPPHMFLDWLEVILLEMNDALGKLTPRYQAVLHGSWASTLALVDSSVDITVIERSLPPGRAGYPHTKYKDLDEETQTYIMDPLKQVKEALSLADLHDAADAKITKDPSAQRPAHPQGYPVLHTQLKVPHVKTAGGKVKLTAKITFGDTYAPRHAIDTVLQLSLYKHFRPLFLFLRALLRQRGLDRLHNGGLTPYVLYSMVRSKNAELDALINYTVGAYLAEAAYNQSQRMWKSKFSDTEDSTAFDDWYSRVEPEYPNFDPVPCAEGHPLHEPVSCDIPIADQLEYARLTAELVDNDMVENAKYLHPARDEGHDLEHLLLGFLRRYTPGHTEAFDPAKQVVCFRHRSFATLEAFNAFRGCGQPEHVYSGTGIMVQDPQAETEVSEGCPGKWEEVQTLFKTVHQTLMQHKIQRETGQDLRPVSDANLRSLACEEHDIVMPEKMAMAPTTLILGRLLSLDLAIGPERWPEGSDEPVFYRMREEASKLLEEMDKEHGLLQLPEPC